MSDERARRQRESLDGASGKLTDKQEMFCREYLIDLNATQAAIRAGYSEKTAQEQASRLLSNVMVCHMLQGLMDERAKRTEVTADMVLRELLLIARTDLSQAYDKDGRLLPVHQMPEDVRRAIAGIKVFDEFDGFGKGRKKIGEVREVKFWDKPRALELLGKHLKLFTEKVEAKIEGEVEVKVSKVDLSERVKQLKGET